MSDDDLIRRRDIGPAICKAGLHNLDKAIAALPARGVKLEDEQAFMGAVWDALKADAPDLGKQQRILVAFRAALTTEADNG